MLTKLRIDPKLENKSLVENLIQQLENNTETQVTVRFISEGKWKWYTAFLFEIKVTWLVAFEKAHAHNWEVKSHPMGELRDAN